MRSRKIFAAALASSWLMWASLCVAQNDPTPLEWGNSVNGLQAALVTDSTSGKNAISSIRLAFKNRGTTDISLILGGHCGPPAAFDSGAVRLTIVDMQSTRHELDHQVGLPYCAGVLGVTTIPLLPGATYSVPIDLVQYRFIARGSDKFETAWTASGTYTLEAQIEAEFYTNPKTRFVVATNRLMIDLPAFPAPPANAR